MKKLLASTAIAATLTLGPAVAQTAAPNATTQDAATALPAETITAPEGYAEAQVDLTRETLKGATVHDATGDEIGEVEDVITADQTAGDGVGTTGNGSAPAPDPASRTDITPGTGSATGTGVDETPGTGSVTGRLTDITPGPGISSEGETRDATATDTAPDTGAAPSADAGADTTATMEASSATGTASETGAAADAPVSPDNQRSGEDISHAIIDVGGFLDMGEHRVAVPVSALVVYESDDGIRIFLPWSRERIEALPAYDENDPASLTR
ncbi:MAG: photosystem reaction center protein H [Paracoccus sp. (in: a-proteobacteria)]|nr:photosystem reaction center protein H [Paracoccus sp. (in: a-proteobacteria)]